VPDQNATTTWRCPQCGLSIGRNAVFCPSCGWTSLEPEKRSRGAIDWPDPDPTVTPPAAPGTKALKVLSIVLMGIGLVSLLLAILMTWSALHELNHHSVLIVLAVVWTVAIACITASIFTNPAGMRFFDQEPFVGSGREPWWLP